MRVDTMQESKENAAALEAKLLKKRTFLKQSTKETLGNETAQAVIRIFETKYFGLKLFWLVCLLGCSGLCFYLVAQTLMIYLGYPVYTTTTIVNEMPTVFPKITICNSVFATTEYAYQLIKQINDVYYPNISIFDQSQMSNLSYSDLQSLNKIYQIFNLLINLDSFSDASRKLLGHPLEDILWYCKFNGQFCSPSDFTWRWDPLYGNCYSFNSGYNSSGAKKSYQQSLLPGAVFGLKLDVYVGYYDKLKAFNVGKFNNYGSNAPLYGLNILIENNTYLTDDKSNVIALNGGTVNYVAVQRKFTTKMPKPYSDCDIDNTNPGKIDSPYYNLILNTPYQYNQELCVIQCMQKKMIQMCNCTMPTFLSLYQDSCQNLAEAFCPYYALKDNTFSIESTIRMCIPQCPLECNSTEFAFQLTSQTFTGILFEALVKSRPVYLADFNTTLVNEATTSNKFVELNLYYDTLSYTTSSDTPSMDIMAFLGNIGGTLGLFLGVSVLCLFELIHVIIESLLHVNVHIKNKHNVEKF
jgi:hypothetical protein